MGDAEECMNTGTAKVTKNQGVRLRHGLVPELRKQRKDAVKLSEKQFMAQVIQFAKLHSWLVYHTHDSRRSEPGFPDLVLVRGERLLFVELKLDDTRTSQEQDKWIDAIRRARVQVLVWRPRFWASIEEVLSGPA